MCQKIIREAKGYEDGGVGRRERERERAREPPFAGSLLYIPTMTMAGLG